STDPLPGTYATVTNGRGPGPVAWDRGRLACATAAALVHRRSESHGGRAPIAPPRPGTATTAAHSPRHSTVAASAPATAVQRAPAPATAVQRAAGFSYCQPPCNERPFSLPRGMQRNNCDRD